MKVKSRNILPALLFHYWLLSLRGSSIEFSKDDHCHVNMSCEYDIVPLLYIREKLLFYSVLVDEGKHRTLACRVGGFLTSFVSFGYIYVPHVVRINYGLHGTDIANHSFEPPTSC